MSEMGVGKSCAGLAGKHRYFIKTMSLDHNTAFLTASIVLGLLCFTVTNREERELEPSKPLASFPPTSRAQLKTVRLAAVQIDLHKQVSVEWHLA
jgi:hypothetical protein